MQTFFDYFQNIQKMLGFAPSRTASKQSGSIFGPPPQQFKWCVSFLTMLDPVPRYCFHFCKCWQWKYLS